jgi:hypothetical protein
MAALGTVRDWAVLTQRAAAIIDSEPDEAGAREWSLTTLRELGSVGSLLRLAGWTAFYTVALILIAASLTAESVPGKNFQINFEYKVF